MQKLLKMSSVLKKWNLKRTIVIKSNFPYRFEEWFVKISFFVTVTFKKRKKGIPFYQVTTPYSLIRSYHIILPTSFLNLFLHWHPLYVFLYKFWSWIKKHYPGRKISLEMNVTVYFLKTMLWLIILCTNTSWFIFKNKHFMT